jgi:hypothetical protein
MLPRACACGCAENFAGFHGNSVCSVKCDVIRRKALRLFELARVLVRLNHVAREINLDAIPARTLRRQLLEPRSLLCFQFRLPNFKYAIKSYASP